MLNVSSFNGIAPSTIVTNANKGIFHLNFDDYGAVGDKNWYLDYMVSGTAPPHTLAENSAAWTNITVAASNYLSLGYAVEIDLPNGLYRFTNALYIQGNVSIKGVGIYSKYASASQTTNSASILWMDNTNPATAGGGLMLYTPQNGIETYSDFSVVGFQNPISISSGRPHPLR